MNPASLYTYFENLDDVFTQVILESFGRLGDALQASAAEHSDEPPTERLIASALAYRQWALDHPAEFNLVFTDQIPGYAAPPDGPTVAAQDAIFGPFIDAVAELMGNPPDDVDADAASFVRTQDPVGPVGLWAMMHGLVMLEINHHLPFIDDRERLFVVALRRTVAGLQR